MRNFSLKPPLAQLITLIINQMQIENQDNIRDKANI